MAATSNVDLNISIDVLTAGAVSVIVNEILEFLLYQRNQIPFVYKTYKYYVNKWLENAMQQEHDAHSLASIQLERQRDLATKTKESIGAVRELIANCIDQHAVKCVRILFGATTFTPKEAYTIHLPTSAISQRHMHAQHPFTQPQLSQTLISLLTNEALYTLFSQNLTPTNVHIEFEMLKSTKEKHMFAKEFSPLPTSCKQVHINLLHTCQLNADNAVLKCCKDLQIYDDFANLNVSEVRKHDEQTKEVAAAPIPNSTTWWEADIIVRGFKEKPIKGMNIWSK